MPSELLVKLLIKFTQENNLRDNYILLDGYPRNLENLQVWNKYMEEISIVTLLLYFECSNECLVSRLLGFLFNFFFLIYSYNVERGKTSGRIDDNIDIIKNRIKIFEDETTPILENYKGVVERINAEKEVDEVFLDGNKINF